MFSLHLLVWVWRRKYSRINRWSHLIHNFLVFEFLRMILSNHHSSLRDWSVSLLLLLLLLCFHRCRSNHPRWQHNYRIWPYMQTARKSVMNYRSERENYARNRCDFSDKIPNTLQLFANPMTDEQRKHVCWITKMTANTNSRQISVFFTGALKVLCSFFERWPAVTYPAIVHRGQS